MNNMMPGVIYYDDKKDMYYLRINNVVLKGNVRDVVGRKEKYKTAVCKYGDKCAIDNCPFYHFRPREERNYKSNIFNKLIHCRSSLKKSIKNYRRKSPEEKNKYYEQHSDFIMHNLLILLALNDDSILKLD
jgi:hypothetical protein